MKTIPNTSYMTIKRFVLRYRYIITVICCMTLHAILCLYQIGKADYWIDEFASLDSVRHSFGYILTQSFYEHNQPPLYFALLWIWHSLFGDGEVALRLLSTIFSVCTVPVVAKIGAVAFNKRVGMAAAFLTACSYFLAIYAQEVRAYSMLCFLSSLSILYFVYFIREYINTEGVSPRLFWIYLCIATANLYVHPYAIFVQAAQFIIASIVIIAYKLPARRMITAGVAMLLLTIPVIAGYLFKSNATEPLLNNAWWISTPNINDFIRTVMYVHIPAHSKRAIVYLYLAISLFVLCGVRGVIALCKYGHAFWKIYWVDALLIATLGMVVVVPFLASFVLSPFFVIRYSIAASVVLYLILARGIALLPWKAVQLSLVFVLCATLMWTTDTLWRGQGKKPQFRLAIQHIIDSGAEGVIILDSEPLTQYQTLNAVEHYIEKNDEFNSALSTRLLKTKGNSVTMIADTLLENNGWYILSNHSGLAVHQIPTINGILNAIDCNIEEPQYYRVMLLRLHDCRSKN